MQNQALKSQGMEKIEQNKANSLSLGFSQSQLPPFGRQRFQFTKCWEDGNGERAGTTATSKLLGLTRSVWHTQPKDWAPLSCLSHTVLVIFVGEMMNGKTRLILLVGSVAHWT